MPERDPSRFALLLCALCLGVAGCGGDGSSDPVAEGPPAGGTGATGPATGATSPAAGARPSASSGLRPLGRPLRLFAATSVWNAPLEDDAPLAKESATYVRSLVAQVRRFGVFVNTNTFSTPVYVVGPDQPTLRVAVTQPERYAAGRLQEQFEEVPLPPGARAAEGTDRHLTLYQPSTDTLWDFFNLRREGGGWIARWGGRLDGASRSPGVLPEPFGSTATGFPSVAGLIYPEELKAARIDHALALTIPETKAGRWALPATRTDGQVPAQSAVREGTRFRLPADLDVDALGLSAPAAAIARAAQRHGIIIRDKGGNVVLYAEDRSAESFKYRPLFGGLDPAALLAKFPWEKLEAVAFEEGRF